jgi:hypothetical protein
MMAATSRIHRHAIMMVAAFHPQLIATRDPLRHKDFYYHTIALNICVVRTASPSDYEFQPSIVAGYFEVFQGDSSTNVYCCSLVL